MMIDKQKISIFLNLIGSGKRGLLDKYCLRALLMIILALIGLQNPLQKTPNLFNREDATPCLKPVDFFFILNIIN